MGVVLHLVVDEASPSGRRRILSPTVYMGYVKVMTSEAWHIELRGLMTGRINSVSRLCGVFGQEGGLRILPKVETWEWGVCFNVERVRLLGGPSV
eukprot:772668-Pelagomonas_calceolata.AAC.1